VGEAQETSAKQRPKSHSLNACFKSMLHTYEQKTARARQKWPCIPQCSSKSTYGYLRFILKEKGWGTPSIEAGQNTIHGGRSNENRFSEEKVFFVGGFIFSLPGGGVSPSAKVFFALTGRVVLQRGPAARLISNEKVFFVGGFYFSPPGGGRVASGEGFFRCWFCFFPSGGGVGLRPGSFRLQRGEVSPPGESLFLSGQKK